MTATPELVSRTCCNVNPSVHFLTFTFQIKENVFEKKYAECLLAKDGSEVIGMALVRTMRKLKARGTS